MKKILSIIFIVTLSSCSKGFLDRHSLVDLAQNSFWQTEKDAYLGINGVYDVLQDRVLYSGNLNGTAGFTQYDGFGDNAYNNYKFEGPGNFMVANINPSDGMFSQLWVSLYKGVARANVAIENIPKIPASGITDASRKVLLGQALFLRSLFYMSLAMYFQDVPLITKVQTLNDAFVPKNTYQEVSAQVMADLTQAITLLPNSYPTAQYGYATKGAALGLLARFHLYNKNFQGVLDATTPLLTMGYGLHPNYSQLFTEAGEFSNEIVFPVRFNQDVSNNGELFSGTFAAAPKVDQQPMKNLVNDYYCKDGKPITSSPLYNAANPKANRDPRLSASVYFKNDTFLLDVAKVFTGNTATGYGQRKYIRNNNSSASGVAVFSPGGQDYYLIRYADILLMRAEAMVELNQLSTVYPLVNQVRARVGMPSVESVEGAGLTQTALRNVVRHERRIELAFEGLRYYDLKRWGEVSNAYQRAIADNVAGYTPVYQAGKAEVFPIPQSELNVNSSLTQITAWQ